VLALRRGLDAWGLVRACQAWGVTCDAGIGVFLFQAGLPHVNAAAVHLTSAIVKSQHPIRNKKLLAPGGGPGPGAVALPGGNFSALFVLHQCGCEDCSEHCFAVDPASTTCTGSCRQVTRHGPDHQLRHLPPAEMKAKVRYWTFEHNWTCVVGPNSIDATHAFMERVAAAGNFHVPTVDEMRAVRGPFGKTLLHLPVPAGADAATKARWAKEPAGKWIMSRQFIDGIASPFSRVPYSPLNVLDDGAAVMWHEAYALTRHAARMRAHEAGKWGQPLSPLVCLEECWRVHCPGKDYRKAEGCAACTGAWDQSNGSAGDPDTCAYPPTPGPREKLCKRCVHTALHKQTMADPKDACKTPHPPHPSWYCDTLLRSERAVLGITAGDCMNADGYPCSDFVLFGPPKCRANSKAMRWDWSKDEDGHPTATCPGADGGSGGGGKF
jgi:hypothetical protein